MLDEIFMWFKKLSLLKFNKKVGATQVVETLGYFKGETRTINKGKAECECEERHSGSLCGHRAAVLPPDRAPRGGPRGVRGRHQSTRGAGTQCFGFFVCC